jgi:hypothetical protein
MNILLSDYFTCYSCAYAKISADSGVVAINAQSLPNKPFFSGVPRKPRIAAPTNSPYTSTNAIFK